MHAGHSHLAAKGREDSAKGERERTLEVGHEGLGATVQSIDDHLTVRGTRDFDPAVFQARGRWSAYPGGIIADAISLPPEVELFPRVETLLNGMASI